MEAEMCNVSNCSVELVPNCQQVGLAFFAKVKELFEGKGTVGE